MKSEDQNRFLSGFEGKILRPSEAYEQARSSYPYRISELVFGGLLASYILGFVSVGVVESTSPNSTPWQIFFNTLVYLIICCSFSFLTAALYSVYHNSILTMPNVRISDLTTDFSIAISQAVFFGIAIIWPSSFLICLGASLLLVLWRQKVKFQALARFFHEKIGLESDAKKTIRDSEQLKRNSKFYSSFHEKLAAVGLSDRWGHVGTSRYVGAIFLIFFGVLTIGGFWLRHFCQTTPNLSGWSKYLSGAKYEAIRGIIYTVVGYFFIRSTWEILKKKSEAFDDMGQNIIKKMDEPATRLANSVKDSFIETPSTST